MADEDCEIEYLDEDKDIVQQCVQVTQSANDSDDLDYNLPPLLVERKFEGKRKRVDEDDSDYDPSEHVKKKKKNVSKKAGKVVKVYEAPNSVQPKEQLRNFQNPKYSVHGIRLVNKSVVNQKPVKKPEKKFSELELRRKLDIKIPDFEDPICLPVRAVKHNDNDLKRLRYWNNMCLEYFKKSDLLKHENGSIVSSKRSIVLRNVKNKNTGRAETMIWSKTVALNEDYKEKIDTFQSFLPRFTEKKSLPPYNLLTTRSREFCHTYEVLLTKEKQKDGDVLVVYNPKEALSAVYKVDTIGKTQSNPVNKDDGDEEKKMVMKEVACCKTCAPCFQSSWRGVRKTDRKENISCKICSRTYVSVYNLLSHLKSHHTNQEVRKNRQLISKTLAEAVDYHYKCRICQEKFLSIKKLRKHVLQHQGDEVFKCEIGNHMAN